MKLGHVHLKVRDLERSVEFYTRLFGLEITEKAGTRFAFLTGSDMHHTIALQEKGEGAPDHNPDAVGLFHVAFEAKDKHRFAESYKKLTSMDITPFLIDHRISWAMYFNDPSGNGLEIYVDTRHETGGAGEWHGKDRPLSRAEVLKALDGD